MQDALKRREKDFLQYFGMSLVYPVKPGSLVSLEKYTLNLSLFEPEK